MPLIEHTAPFRLRAQRAIVSALEEIVQRDKSGQPLAGLTMEGKVFRGRSMYGENDPLPLISILEPPLPIDQIVAPRTATGSTGDWDLLIQGFVQDDNENPTDPAHFLMADVKARLAAEKKGRNFGMAVAQQENGKGCGNVITGLVIGPGVVRPPEAGVSNKAYFWLTLTLKIAEDNERPFL